MRIQLQPTLKNALIQIRPLAPDDLEPLFEVAKDPKIWEQHHANRFLKPEFETFFQDSIQSKGALVIIDQKTGKIIGSSRFKPFDGFPDVVEIGWTFMAREYWGGKYNRVIKDLMLYHAFKQVNTVLFYIKEDNLRSQKAVGKLKAERVDDPENSNLPKASPGFLTFVIQKENWR